MPEQEQHLPYSLPDASASCEAGSIYETVRQAVRKHLPAGASILDVGCGRGELIGMLSAEGYAVTGCDADEECVRLSSRHAKVEKLDIREISAERFEDKFDCVLMSHVLEHVDNPRETLTRLAGLTDNLLIVSVPNPYYSPYILRALLRTRVDYVNRKHLYSWDWCHFKTFAEIGCGLEIVDFLHDSVALPLPYRVRSFLGRKKLLKPLEYGFLRLIFPRFCSSITAVMRKKPGRPS